MKFSKNIIDFFIEKKYFNIKKIVNILNKNNFEVINIYKKNFNNIKLILGKILKIKKNNLYYELYIYTNEKKNIIINTYSNYFKKNTILVIFKKKIEKCENKYDYSIYFDYLIYNKKSIFLNKFKNKIFSDILIDIKLPFNRNDCLNILGISRIISINNNLKIKIPKERKLINKEHKYLNIKICNNICNYYYCRLINNIFLSKYKTPIYIKEYLKNLEIKTFNNIKDIINYINIKTGYFINIIDYKLIENGLLITNSNNNDNNFLIKKLLKNDKNIPIIKDINNNIVLIPNIYKNYNINENTNNILLGCGIYNIKKKFLINSNNFIKKNYFKYKTGLDPNLLNFIIKYSTNIINNIIGGNNKKIIKLINNDIKIIKINIYYNNIRNLIGTFIHNKTIIKILKLIKCKFYKIFKNFIIIIPPIYRNDLKSENDIIIEILKYYNINNIKDKKFTLKTNFDNIKIYKKNNKINKIKNFLINNKYYEVINSSLENKYKQNIFYDKNEIININNPITKNENSIRKSLLSGLIKNYLYNKKYKINFIKIFEIGKCYEYKNNNIINNNMLSLLSTININDNEKKITNFFYENKNYISNILEMFVKYNDFIFLKESIFIYNNNYSLSIYYKKKKIGIIGIINNNIFKNINKINNLLLYSEINLKILDYYKFDLLNKVYNTEYIKKNITFYIKNNINIEELIKYIYSIKIKNFIKLEILDIYYDFNSNIKIIIRLYFKDKILINNSTNFLIYKLKNKFSIFI